MKEKVSLLANNASMKDVDMQNARVSRRPLPSEIAYESDEELDKVDHPHAHDSERGGSNHKGGNVQSSGADENGYSHGHSHGQAFASFEGAGPSQRCQISPFIVFILLVMALGVCLLVPGILMRMDGFSMSAPLLQVQLCEERHSDKQQRSKHLVGTNAETCGLSVLHPAGIGRPQRLRLSNEALVCGVHYVPFILLPQHVQGTVELELRSSKPPHNVFFSVNQTIHVNPASTQEYDDYLLVKSSHDKNAVVRVFSPHRPGEGDADCTDPSHGCPLTLPTGMNKLILKHAHFFLPLPHTPSNALSEDDDSPEAQAARRLYESMKHTTTYANNLELWVKRATVTVNAEEGQQGSTHTLTHTQALTQSQMQQSRETQNGAEGSNSATPASATSSSSSSSSSFPLSSETASFLSSSPSDLGPKASFLSVAETQTLAVVHTQSQTQTQTQSVDALTHLSSETAINARTNSQSQTHEHLNTKTDPETVSLSGVAPGLSPSLIEGLRGSLLTGAATMEAEYMDELAGQQQGGPGQSEQTQTQTQPWSSADGSRGPRTTGLSGISGLSSVGAGSSVSVTRARYAGAGARDVFYEADSEYPVLIGFQQYTLSETQKNGVSHMIKGIVLLVMAIAALTVRCWTESREKFE